MKDSFGREIPDKPNTISIPESIERLQGSLDHNTILITRKDKAALKLVIAAAEAWQEHREHHLPQYRWLLPGETE